MGNQLFITSEDADTFRKKQTSERKMSSTSNFQLKASIPTNKSFLGISIVKGKNSGISIGTILKGKNDLRCFPI